MLSIQAAELSSGGVPRGHRYRFSATTPRGSVEALKSSANDMWDVVDRDHVEDCVPE